MCLVSNPIKPGTLLIHSHFFALFLFPSRANTHQGNVTGSSNYVFWWHLHKPQKDLSPSYLSHPTSSQPNTHPHALKPCKIKHMLTPCKFTHTDQRHRSDTLAESHRVPAKAGILIHTHTHTHMTSGRG